MPIWRGKSRFGGVVFDEARNVRLAGGGSATLFPTFLGALLGFLGYGTSVRSWSVCRTGVATILSLSCRGCSIPSCPPPCDRFDPNEGKWSMCCGRRIERRRRVVILGRQPLPKRRKRHDVRVRRDRLEFLIQHRVLLVSDQNPGNGQEAQNEHGPIECRRASATKRAMNMTIHRSTPSRPSAQGIDNLHDNRLRSESFLSPFVWLRYVARPPGGPGPGVP